MLLAAAALVTSVVTSWISALHHHEAFELYQALLTFGGVFLVAVASHFGFWKPTGVADAAQNAIGGIGGKHAADSFGSDAS
ncbi:hypothetical protein [Leifsonia sp. NPDC077715]|uniref:hypothetical protein n=1 Tax=Leifsonia sp. NPDC077715 TaxID=3155539 RepID=UPI00342187E6